MTSYTKNNKSLKGCEVHAFGSTIRGQLTAASDADVLVIAERYAPDLIANSLHINFYENWMTPEAATKGAEAVKELIEKLQ